MSVRQTPQEQGIRLWVQGVLDRMFQIQEVTIPETAPALEAYSIDLDGATEVWTHVVGATPESGSSVIRSLVTQINAGPSALVEAVALEDRVRLYAIDPAVAVVVVPGGSGAVVSTFTPIAIRANQTVPDGTRLAPRPPKPFVTYLVAPETLQGTLETETTNVEHSTSQPADKKWKKHIIARYTGQVSIQAFGEDARLIMRKLVLSIGDSAVVDANHGNNLYSLWPLGSIDAALEVGTIFENRALADWGFAFGEAETVAADAIETIDPTVDV